MNVMDGGNGLRVNNAGLVCGGVPMPTQQVVHDRDGADATRPVRIARSDAAPAATYLVSRSRAGGDDRAS